MTQHMGKTKSKLVWVDWRHIDNGQQFIFPRSRTCPTALALRDAGLREPTVTQNAISDGRWPAHKQYHIPRSVQRFVNRADKKLPLKPFAFKLVPA